ncbi:MAG: hypothetical protein VKI82_07610 [Leptolyngbya sp.]|nr:hypothetical protein [Leptolyngbya sp.]
MSLVGFAALGAFPMSSALARPDTATTSPSNPLEATRQQDRFLSQGHREGQDDSHPAPGRPCQEQGQGREQEQERGQGPRGDHGGEHLEAVAEQLGVSEAALRSALGIPDQPPQRPDLAAAAAQLGTTEEELRTSLHEHMQSQHQSRPGQGPQAGPPDFTALAQQYGVSEAEFRSILGIPNRPDLAAAASQLGVSEAALRDALRSAAPGPGPGGRPGPSDRPGPSGRPGPDQ